MGMGAVRYELCFHIVQLLILVLLHQACVHEN